MAVEVGQQVPDVTLVNADRKPVKLREVASGPTVLAFFPAAFSVTCTKEMCAFRDQLARFNELRANVIGISVDLPHSQKAFADAHGLTFPLLSDFTREAVRAFGIEDPTFAGGVLPGVAQRSVFVIDRNGVVRYKWVAPSPGTEPDYAAVEQAVRAVH